MSHSTTQRSYLKDLHQLYRMIEASTDGQASIVAANELSVVILLNPNSGYNAHAEFTVKIKCLVTFPGDAPEVKFASPIFHPNIDIETGHVCLNILNKWLSCYNLLDVVKSLLYLIDHPNFDSAINPFAHLENMKLLAKKTMRVLAGLPVNGQQFAPNKAWCEWAEAHGCLPAVEEEDNDEDGAGNIWADVTQVVGVEREPETDDEHEAISGVDAFANKEDNNEDCEVGAAVFDENVLSFANIPLPIASNNNSQLSLSYKLEYMVEFFKIQRILIWPPTDTPNVTKPSVFYFWELVGDESYQFEFCNHHNTMFTSDVLHSMQSSPESRQTSSLCPWYSFYRPEHYSDHLSFDANYGTSFILSQGNMPIPILTNDFCPWSQVDGKGMWDILGGLFFEQQQRRSSAASTPSQEVVQGCNMELLSNTSFEVENGDADKKCKEEEEVEDKEWVVDEKTEHSEAVEENQQDASKLEQKEGVDYLSTSKDATSVLVAEEVREMEAQDEISVSADTQSSWSSLSFETEPEEILTLMEDGDTNIDYFHCVVKNNAKLQPHWQWFFRQTRWPFRFAPQQNVDVSVHENRIPPWRASVGRLLSDVCNFCKRNHQMQNLILLDPMALSPLSPLLNLMRHSVKPKAHLTGILWMTPLDALSPFYPVPIPRQNGNSEEEKEELKRHPYPRPLYLRFLTLAAFLSNWLAWFSRVETYSSLGMSRFPPAAVSDPVAGCVLRPYSLGCGQFPFIDLWPLWLAQRLPLLPFYLPLLCGRTISRHLLPFTDLDEI